MLERFPEAIAFAVVLLAAIIAGSVVYAMSRRTRRNDAVTSTTEKVRAHRADRGRAIAAMTRCALCRSVIGRNSFTIILNKGESYHAGCWDRIRHEAPKKKAS
jgi:hypothetical protein